MQMNSSIDVLERLYRFHYTAMHVLAFHDGTPLIGQYSYSVE